MGQHFREAEIIAQAAGQGRHRGHQHGRPQVDHHSAANLEGLAKRDAAEGLDPDSEEGRERVAELTAKHDAETRAEGDRVRDLGGLYVLGTERHDSRRIDNQLRPLVRSRWATPARAASTSASRTT